jgi:hypothetical protein
VGLRTLHFALRLAHFDQAFHLGQWQHLRGSIRQRICDLPREAKHSYDPAGDAQKPVNERIGLDWFCSITEIDQTLEPGYLVTSHGGGSDKLKLPD